LNPVNLLKLLNYNQSKYETTKIISCIAFTVKQENVKHEFASYIIEDNVKFQTPLYVVY